MLEEFVRPRWGIGSVRLHLDIEDLALGLILFDRIVLPTPDGADEERRFADEGWEPERQAIRGVQLDPLVHFVAWDDDLRARWARGMGRWADRLGPAAREVEGLGYFETTNVIAHSAWTAVDRADESYVHKPVPQAWCPATAGALSRLGLSTAEPPEEDDPASIEILQMEYDDPAAGAEPDGLVSVPEGMIASEAILATRELALPSGNEERVLQQAAALARDPGFVAARGRVFAAIFAMAAQGVPRDQIVDELAAAEEAFAAKLDEYASGGARRVIHQLLPTTTAGLGKAAGLPGGGIGWLVRKGLTKFVPLPDRPNGSGEALALSTRILPCVYSESFAGPYELSQYPSAAHRFVDSGLAGRDGIVGG